MRIATNTLYDRGLAAIDVAQRHLSRAQQQVATGNKVNAASDDPVAATEILRTTSALANNTQYMANQSVATRVLAQTDSTLGQVGDVLQGVRTTMLAANNAVLSDADRAALATELKSRLDELVSLANTKDGDGHFLFGGYRNDAVPFARTGAGVTYAGDDGQRSVQVAAARQMDIGTSGADVFNRIGSGNGVFTTAPSSTNGGTGLIDVGQVTSPAALTGHAYQLKFTVAGGATTYAVLDTTTGSPVAAPALSGNAYTSGNAITFTLTISIQSGTITSQTSFTQVVRLRNYVGP